jgi:WD40 repeat protein
MLRRSLPLAALAVACCSLVAQPPAEVKPSVTFKGHTEPVYAVGYSPDGKLVATGSFDKSIKLWDAANGKELRTLGGPQGHQSLVLSVAFSPAGDQLASGGADNFARVWDVPSAKPTTEAALGGKGVKVAVSPDGKQYAAGNSDGKVRVWSAGDGKQVVEISTGTGVVALAFSPNGQTILTAGADRILRYWTVANGQPIAAVGTGPTELNGLLAHPSGNVVTTSTDGTIRVWPQQPQPAKKLADLASATLAVPSPDGNAFAVAMADKSIKLVNAGSGQVTATIPAAPAAVEAVAWNGDNATLAVATGNKVLLWGTDGKARGEIAADAKAVRAVSFAASKTDLLTAGDDGKLKLWKLPVDPKKPAKPKAVVADVAGVKLATMLPSGQALAIGAGKAVKAWDVNAGKDVRTFGTLADAPKAWALSRDGALVAAAAGKSVKLWQTADGKELHFPALPADVTSLAFSPDRQFLLVGTADKSATIFSVATGQPQQFFPAAGNPVAVAYHPSQPLVYVIDDKSVTQHPVSFVRNAKDADLVRGNLTAVPNTNSLLTLSATKTLGRWNVGNLQKEQGMELAGPATAFAVSKNGQLLATVGADSTVQVYTLSNNQLAGSFKVAAKVSELAFHPNGQSLAGVLDGKTVTVWNVLFTTGQPLPAEFGSVVQTFPHPAAVTSIAYLNEQQLVTGDDAGTARTWRVASDQPTRVLQHPNLVDCVAFDKHGKQLATACHDGIVRVYDLSKPGAPPVREIKAHVAMPQPHPVYVVAWSPDGKLLATGSFDQSIKLWDAVTGNPVREIKGFPLTPPEAGKPVPPGHRDQVFCLAFSKDGKLLASGSSDRTVKLWEVATGNLVRDFPNPNLKASGPGQPVPSHAGFVHAVRFAADGQSLVSAGTAPRNQGSLAVWAVADGKLKAASEIAFGPIYALDLAADGKSVLIGCGPRVRTASEAEAYVIPLPTK